MKPPPVPSELVAQARHFLLRLQPNIIDGRRVLDDLESSIATLESTLEKQRGLNDMQAKRIAELEAEVVELKQCCEEWAANYDDQEKEVAELRGKLEVECAEKRLAEATLAALRSDMPRSWPWGCLSASCGSWRSF